MALLPILDCLISISPRRAELSWSQLLLVLSVRLPVKSRRSRVAVLSDSQEPMKNAPGLRMTSASTWRSIIVDGLENALQTLKKIFTGTNTGKLIIRVKDV